MPIISVIVPIYNVEKYLKRCINSILNQTLKDIEIICIDDCSTDNSLSILKSFKDNRIKIITLDKNIGVADIRNIGLDNVEGEYISFVDSDDYIDDDFLEKLYLKAQSDSLDIAASTLAEIDYNNIIHIRKEAQLLKQTKDKFYACTDFKPAIYRTVLIKENNVRFPSGVILCEDMIFLTEVLIKAQKVGVVPEVKYYYCRRLNSGNSQFLSKEQIESALPILEKMAELYNSCEESEGVIYAYTNILNIISTFIFKTNEKQIYDCLKSFFKIYDMFKNKDLLEVPSYIKNFSSLDGETKIKKTLFLLNTSKTIKMRNEEINKGRHDK